MDLVVHLYQAQTPLSEKVHWNSPTLLASLEQLRSLQASTHRELHAWLMDTSREPASTLVIRLVETAIRLEGADGDAMECPFLMFVYGLLHNTSAALILSTIHGAKGLEHPHVILWQYNLLGLGHNGWSEEDQDRNLLYIAVTRALQRLTFLTVYVFASRSTNTAAMSPSTIHVRSPFLSVDAISMTTQ